MASIGLVCFLSSLDSPPFDLALDALYAHILEKEDDLSAEYPERDADGYKDARDYLCQHRRSRRVDVRISRLRKQETEADNKVYHRYTTQYAFRDAFSE